jgi:hypothetical protein
MSVNAIVISIDRATRSLLLKLRKISDLTISWLNIKVKSEIYNKLEMEKTMHNQSQINSNLFQNLDAIAGIEEISDEMSAIYSGGNTFSSTVNFDSQLFSRNFTIKPGTKGVFLDSNTKGGDDGNFTVFLENLSTGSKVARNVKVGKDSTSWLNAQGPGNYRLEFSDKKDGKNVTGDITVVA